MATVTASSIKEGVKRILALPYARELVRNSDGTWHARVVEFPGCMTEGDTQEEALTNLEDAITGWVEIHLEDGDSIPPPIAVDDYSGKFMVRIPKSLHRNLARLADADGVSLNQYVSVRLAQPFYIEKRPDGDCAANRDGATRRSASRVTQPKAIQGVKGLNPDASVQAKRVRNTDKSGHNQRRKS